MTTILDRVAVHGDTGTVTVTRDQYGTYYVTTRTRKGDTLTVPLPRETVTAPDGLIDQLARFAGQPMTHPTPEPPTFTELLQRGLAQTGMTVKGLGRAVGVASGSPYYWTWGLGLPRKYHLPRIAEALDLDLDTLIDAYGRAVVAATRKQAAS